MVTNRYATQTYENHRDLGDGSYLEMRITYFADRRIYETEDVPDPEPFFRLDGESILREDLPPEITAEVIEELIHSANPTKVSGAGSDDAGEGY